MKFQRSYAHTCEMTISQVAFMPQIIFFCRQHMNPITFWTTDSRIEIIGKYWSQGKMQEILFSKKKNNKYQLATCVCVYVHLSSKYSSKEVLLTSTDNISLFNFLLCFQFPNEVFYTGIEVMNKFSTVHAFYCIKYFQLSQLL